MPDNMVDEAIEVLMHRYDINVEAAQALLAQLSTRHSIEDVARRLVDPLFTPTTAASNEQIHVRIAAVIREVYDRSPTVQAALDELTAAAAQFVPGAQYAGITTTARRKTRYTVQTPSATGPYPRLLDTISNRHHQGPCVDALGEERTVRVDDLSTETRWPMYRREALARTPIRSVMSFALRAHQRTLGALNFFAEDPHAFNASAQDVGFAYATHAALAWDALRRDAQFREALRSRDVISQAKGMLMERYHIDATEAFVRLREQSQISNVPLVDIARSVTEEHNA